MSAMKHQFHIITEALADKVSIDPDALMNMEFPVFEPILAQDDRFTWHVSFDHRLFSVITNKSDVLSIAQVR
jgi:hypothetical protein